MLRSQGFLAPSRAWADSMRGGKELTGTWLKPLSGIARPQSQGCPQLKRTWVFSTQLAEESRGTACWQQRGIGKPLNMVTHWGKQHLE